MKSQQAKKIGVFLSRILMCVGLCGFIIKHNVYFVIPIILGLGLRHIVLKKYMPYNFDFKYELNTYKNIGVEHELQYKAETNLFYLILIFFRRCWNFHERRYKNINTSYEWESYVEGCLRNKKLLYNHNLTNFLGYLNGKKNSRRDYLELLKSIVAPIYIGLIAGMSIFSGMGENNSINGEAELSVSGNNADIINLNLSDVLPFEMYLFCLFSLMTIVILILLLYWCKKNSCKYNFLCDYTKIVESVNTDRLEHSARSEYTERKVEDR